MKKRRGNLSWEAVKSIWHMIRAYKKWFVVSSGVSIVLVFAQLAQARLTQSLIDTISVGKMGKFVAAAIGFLLIVGVTAILNYVRQTMVAKMSACTVRNLKCNVSEALLEADYLTLTMEHSGNAMSTVNHDIAAVGDFLKKDLSDLFSQFTMAAGTFIYMLCLSPKLALLTFAYMPVGVWFLFRANKKISPYYTVMADESGKSLSVVEQVLTQIPVIKSFLSEKRMRKKIYENYRQVYHAQVSAAARGIWVPFLGTAAIQIPRITYLGFGGYLVLQGALSVGAMVSMLDLLSFIIQPVTALPWLVQGLNATFASVRRIQRLQKIPSGGRPERDLEGSPAIEIRNITFGYQKERTLFHDFSFQQREPGITVICGGSGSGKTTLLDLIAGLCRPDRGSIAVTGKISVVLQDTYLFADSLLENVRLSKPDASEAEVRAALIQAGAYDFAMELPNGLNTVLGDGNQNLSGGQRQRIGLARTILQDSPIWLLDEPTSALDPETERIILNVLQSQRKKRIILISAHRHSLISLADRKVVL